MIPRVFLEQDLSLGHNITISDKNSHYLIDVLRCKIGQEVILINGKDGEFLGEIEKITHKKIDILLKEKTREFYKQDFLGLIFAPIQKLDILVKSATELGVTDFLPIKTDYTTHPKIDRILPNVIEAVEQCERLDLPCIHKLSTLKEVLDSIEDDALILFCEERSGLKSIKEIGDFNSKKIYCLVGAEGGFSESEKTLIRSYKNAISINLGTLILRSETATISILTLAKNGN
ncbi:MAG: 16S rRNA (uracil(1498)-N(3))-methyltransferase [Rickettsiales bacterium]|nr:MAG: 16S rRNA (uracil(1498)-N(3))-methyltransferase [Rickettsiales bacterium]